MALSLTCSGTSCSHLSGAHPGAHLFPRATGTPLSSLATPSYQMGKTAEQIKLPKISFLVGAETLWKQARQAKRATKGHCAYTSVQSQMLQRDRQAPRQ